jgi:ubiquinone/menaquinone biosynthesis C-methylase UbiE
MRLLCPVCQNVAGELDDVTEQGMPCTQCGFCFQKVDGIVRAIAPDRRPFYDRFLADYGTIRKAEGRGSNSREYYLALPYQDLSERNTEQWRIRACTYRYFEKKLLQDGSLDILDLGAGNGWMSYRLAQRGRRPVAVDIFADPQDGLAAAREYGLFPLVEAEFDRLPFAAGQFDLAIFNSSLHYSTDYHGTLGEARRCLKPSGSIVVLDSPLYKLREHGELMRTERHVQFQAQYGFASDSIANLEYLYESQLAELSRDLGLRWQIYEPWYGWDWLFRPLKASLRGRRPPSRFCILVASFSNS